MGDFNNRVKNSESIGNDCLSKYLEGLLRLIVTSKSEMKMTLKSLDDNMQMRS